MPVLRINEFPEGSGSLSNDDILLFMDDPSGSGITKKISLSQISSAIAAHNKAYGSFFDTTTQTNPSSTGINTMTFNNTDVNYNIDIVDGSKLTVYRNGTYNIQFSAQLEKTDGGNDLVDIWISKNGSDINWSNTRVSMHQQDAKSVAAWNFLVPLNSGDYIQFQWHSSDLDMRILAQSGLINPIRPNIPSIILTAIEI